MIGVEKRPGIQFAGKVLFFKLTGSYVSVLKNSFSQSAIQVFEAADLDGARKIFSSEDPDMVLVDYDSETETSIKFLDFVKKNHPSIYRLVLCGAENKKQAIYLVFKSIANISFEKPHGLVYLVPGVVHLLETRKILKKNKMLTLLSSIENLVALPPTYYEFNKAIKRNKSREEIIKILEKDISISTKILQVSNSVFSKKKKIASIEQAFEYLGLDTIKKIVTIFCYTSAKELNDVETKNFTTIINHSVRVNNEFLSSFELRTKKTLPDSFASVGLTHDIGKIIVLKYLPDRFNKSVGFLEEHPNEDFYSSEIKLGFKGNTHAEFGAYLLDLWNLPQENVNIALYHHNQEEAPDSYKQILEIYDDVNFDIEICKFTKMFQ